jgi:hypothetical protein
MKLFNYIDNVELSENMKARLIAAAKDAEGAPQKQKMTFASKNLIAIGASAAAIIILFGGLMFFMPRDEGHGGVLSSNTNESAVTTPAPETVASIQATVPTELFTTAEAPAETISPPELPTIPVTERTIPTFDPDTQITVICERSAKEAALRRYRQVFTSAAGEVKSIEIAEVRGFSVYRIDIGTPGSEYGKYYRVEINMMTGEILRDFHFNFIENPVFSKEKVKIISGGQEFEVFERWTHGWGNEMFASGRGVEPWVIYDLLTDIPYSRDFSIEFFEQPDNMQGDRAGHALYSLYNADFENVYEWQDRFTIPRRSGEYYLSIHASWTDEDGNGSSWQFWAKIVV